MALRAARSDAGQMLRDETQASERRAESVAQLHLRYARHAADTFGQFARRAKSEPGWRYFEIDASHSPNVTAPQALMTLLQGIVA